MDKRNRPLQGYFAQLDNIILHRKRVLSKREILDGEYFVEKLLGKRTKGKEIQLLVKWQDWSLEDSTWEPQSHLPHSTVEAFEHPLPHIERVEEARERLALFLERGLKTGLRFTEVMEMRHNVIILSRKPYLAVKQDFIDAGLERYLERTVCLAGERRRVLFPVHL